jgi:hypothetical protein
VSDKRPAAWPALILALVAGGAVLWHLFACVESPMAFSPDGRNLAFVTMEPYSQDASPRPGKVAFRLMVLADGERLRVVEETNTLMLSAPAFSPDGKRLCYLRVPLATEEQATALKGYVEKRVLPENANVVDWRKKPAGGDLASYMRAPAISMEDGALPKAGFAVEFARVILRAPPMSLSLVVRDVSSDSVISTTEMELPLAEADAAMRMYLLARPQFGADGHTVFVTTDMMVVAVDTWTGVQRIVAAPTSVARLSPNGKALAVHLPGVLGLVAADGSRATYVRWEKEVGMFGLGWADSETVAVFEPKKGEKSWIHLVRPDGSIRKSIPIALALDKQGDNVEMAEAVLSPDGRSIVVSLGKAVLFLSSDGKERNRLTDLKQYLGRATFSPDSRRIAFKCLAENEPYHRVVAIVFYSPDGKELSRVPIPPVAAAMTQPADGKK